ncbi:DUF1700 domain-containing protein [Kribbella sp. NPDC055071]
MNSTLTGAVATYLAEVRAELSDLPPGELEDVLDDVSGHLTEVAAEFEGQPTTAALQERLGTPQQYADELRTAAGYPPRPEPVSDAHRKDGWKALRWGLIAAVVGPIFIVIGLLSWQPEVVLFFGVVGLAVLFGAAFLGVRALHGNDPRTVLDTPQGARGAGAIRNGIDQLPPSVRKELVGIGQPVWWVVRGVIGGGGFFSLFGFGPVTVVGAIAGAAVSIWIGRKTQQDRRWLWYVVPLNVLAIVAVPVLLLTASGATLPSYNGNPSAASYNPPGLSLDGTPVTNIYPFDAQGKQVDVRLYDQDGRPIGLSLQDCIANYGYPNDSQGDTGMREATTNLFPLVAVSSDPNGYTDAENCKDTTKAPFVPPPAPAVRTSPTPTPTPSAKPSSEQSGTPSSGPTTKPTIKPTSGRGPTPTPGVTLTVQPSR